MEGPANSNNLSLQSSVKICDDVVSRDLEGEAVILNLETGTYFGLNEVGTRIWSLIQENGSLQNVFEVIKREYEVSPEVLESDLLGIIDQLRSRGLVSVS